MENYAKWIILIFVLLFFITFGIKNNQQVQLNYYPDFKTAELPLYGLVYISILIGIFTGMIIGIRNRLYMKKMVKNLEKENKDLRDKMLVQERIEEKTGQE